MFERTVSRWCITGWVCGVSIASPTNRTIRFFVTRLSFHFSDNVLKLEENSFTSKMDGIEEKGKQISHAETYKSKFDQNRSAGIKSASGIRFCYLKPYFLLYSNISFYVHFFMEFNKLFCIYLIWEILKYTFLCFPFLGISLYFGFSSFLPQSL